MKLTTPSLKKDPNNCTRAGNSVQITDYL